MAETHASGLRTPVAWQTASGLTDYPAAVARMETAVDAIRAGAAPEQVWLVEHDHVYTAGTSAVDDELVDAAGVPVIRTGRGGRFTYHGPGQRVAYVMLDLRRRRPDVRAFVHDLEGWLIDTLGALGIEGARREGRVGIWVETAAGEAKIAALGIRLRRWVSFHGVALNVAPDLERFHGIVPCGIRTFGVTSLAALGCNASMAVVDEALRTAFERRFGSTTTPQPVDFELSAR